MRIGVRRLPFGFLLVAPALALFVVYFVVPFGVLAINSFYDYGRLTGIVPIFTTKNYVRILSDPFYLDIVLRTMRLAGLTSLATLLLGYPVALYLTVAPPRWRGWIVLLVISPLLVSVIVRTFGWLIILGPNGVLDSFFEAIGVGSVELLHTEFAAVAGLTNVLLPFMVLSIATSLQAIDPAIPAAASSLGASPLRVFREVTLPLSLPGLLAGGLIVFSLASSSFVTPALLAGSEYKVMSVVIYQQAMVLQNWPLAAGLAVVLLLVVLLALAAQSRLVEGGKYKMVFH
jgi:putative spermidine/putrescine transport system permease protein